jgi:uncharacterized protein DUF1707
MARAAIDELRYIAFIESIWEGNVMDTTDGGAARVEARGSATSTQDTESAVGQAGAVSADDTGAPDGAVGAGWLPSVAGRAPATRASDRERDAVVQRIQQAFAEGRLDDAEFDERMRAALTARTHAVEITTRPPEHPALRR